MVKNASLSSDIDLIKELESLRIKQKLLIETLSKEKTENSKEILIHIDAKLDFLVKIFQESSNSYESEQVKLENKVSEEKSDNSKLNDQSKDKSQDEKTGKENSFETKVLDKLNFIEVTMKENLEILSNEISSLKSSFPLSNVESSNLPPIPSFEDDMSSNNKKNSTSNNNMEAKNDSNPDIITGEIVDDLKIKKKGKWF